MPRVLSVLVAPLLCAIVAAFPAGGQPPPEEPPLPKYPMTGKAVAEFEPFDKAIVTVLARHGIPGASLAIAKDGKLLYARGYGWSDLRADERVNPDTLFGLASLSKLFTSLAILKLVEQGKLSLDDKAFEIIKHIKPNPGVKVDPRLAKITVRHLLIHAGGWDTQKSGDPVNWTTRVNLERTGRDTITAEQLISFTLGMKLDFDPGTDCKYSNFGYIVLGEVIEMVSGQNYEKFVKETVLKPAGPTRATLHPLNGKYFPNEARRYLAGHDEALPPWQEKKADAAGGWSATAVDIVRVLTALDGSRGKGLLDEKTFKLMLDPPASPIEPKADGTYFAPGWDMAGRTEKVFAYQKGGNWFGIRTFAQRTPLGVNWSILMNASLQPDVTDSKMLQDAIHDVRETLEKHKAFPNHDLFGDYK